MPHLRSVLICIPSALLFAGAMLAGPGLVGGQSIYDKYAGKIEITRVEKTEASIAQANTAGGPRYEGYEVWFRFATELPISQEFAQKAVEKEQPFLLANSWFVGEKYIEKYGISVGAIFPCTLKVIRQGAGTPIIFDIENLNRIDYFEVKKKK